ncbi:hypothetical protein ABPG73_021584 [Tetrahymena malaccensis]
MNQGLNIAQKGEKVENVVRIIYLIRVFWLIYRIQMIYLLIVLYEIGFCLFSILIIICQMIEIIHIIRQDQQNTFQKNILFRYFLQTNYCQGSQIIFSNTQILLISFQSFFLQIQAIFKSDQQIHLVSSTQIITSCLTLLMSLANKAQSQQINNIYKIYLIRLAKKILVPGLFFQNLYQFPYIIIAYSIVLIFMLKFFYSIKFEEKILSLKFKHDEINQNMKRYFISNFIFSLIGFQINLLAFQRKNNVNFINQEIANKFYERAFQGIVSIQITILFIIAVGMNSNVTLSMMMLYTLFGLLLIDFKENLSFLIKCIKDGPLLRIINMDGDQIKDLTEDQIFNEYYNFNNEQKYIGIKSKNFDRKILCKVVLQLIKYDKTIKIISQQQNYFLLSKDSKCIQLQIRQDWFAQGCFDILNHLKPFSLNIKIKFSPQIENVISNFIFQNFDLIPFLEVHLSDSFSMKLINQIKAETLRFITYNKIQAFEMTVNPKQAYFDLIDL